MSGTTTAAPKRRRATGAPRPQMPYGAIAATAAGCFTALTVAVAVDGTWSWEQRGAGPYVAWAVAAGSRNTAAVALCAAAAVAAWRRSSTLGAITAALAAATGAVPTLQATIGRADTPGAWLYPSGHTTGAVVAGICTYATVGTLTDSRTARRTAAGAAIAVGTVGTVAAVVSGTHYPTDAAGSIAWVVAWAAAAAWAATRRPPARPTPGG